MILKKSISIIYEHDDLLIMSLGTTDSWLQAYGIAMDYIMNDVLDRAGCDSLGNPLSFKSEKIEFCDRLEADTGMVFSWFEGEDGKYHSHIYLLTHDVSESNPVIQETADKENNYESKTILERKPSEESSHG